MVAKGLDAAGGSAARQCRVHDRRHRRIATCTRRRPKGARRSCGCTSCWPTSSRASPRSTCRSASRSIRFRRSSARCCRRISTISAAIRPTRAPRASARPPPPGSAGATGSAGRSTPRPKSSCSTARARACSSARIAAKRYVPQRAGKPAILIPNPFYAAYSAGAAAADCEPVYLPTTRETGFLPDLDALDEALLARTVAFYLASPSNPQGAVADEAYLARLVALARRFGFLVFADECYCEIYLNGRAPHGMLEASAAGFRQRRGVPLAVEALQPAGAARRLRRRRPPLPRPLRRAAQHRGAAGAGAGAGGRRSRPMATRPMSRRTASSTSRNSISPTRSSATATATSVRPAASSSGSTSARTAATRRSP